MPRIDIKQHHPNLYYVILAVSLTFYGIGGLGLRAPRHGWMPWLFLIPFFVIPTITLYGLFAPHYRYVRLGTLLGAVYSFFFAIAFSLSIVVRWSGLNVKLYSWLVPPWLLWSFIQFVGLKEPPEQPLTDRDFNPAPPSLIGRVLGKKDTTNDGGK